jgi:hypothetical protein
VALARKHPPSQKGAGSEDHSPAPDLPARAGDNALHMVAAAGDQESLHAGLLEMEVGRRFQGTFHAQRIAALIGLGA